MNKIINYSPFQPDYRRRPGYKHHLVSQDSPLYGIVYEFYELTNDQSSSDIILKALPDGIIDMVIVFDEDGDRFHIGAGDGKLYNVRYRGVKRIFGMGLMPGVVKELLSVRAIDVVRTGRIDLSDLESFLCMKEDMLAAESFKERIQIATDMLLCLLSEKSEDNAVICHSVNQIVNHLDEFRVEKVANDVGYSLRYFRKIFTEYVGYSPQKFMRIVRFQNSYRALFQGEYSKSLTEISAEYGYYDLSHMNKEYQLLAGKLPCELKKILS